MSDSGSGARYFWCLRHHRVETDADVCAARYVLGPYASVSDAEHAMEKVQQRNEAWDAEDARWAGEER
jgi:glycerol-3-phosphate dehydrogenase